MKKILPVGLILCAALLCACSTAAESTASQEQTAVTSGSSDVTTSSGSDVASTPTPSPSPSPSPVPARPEVKVTDAVSKVIDIEGYSFAFNIPEVSIQGHDMSGFNSKVKSELEKYYKDFDAKDLEDGYEPYSVIYIYYVSDNIVSICVRLQNLMLDADWEYYIYNISIETGKEVSGSEVIKDSGMTDDEFFDKVRQTYETFRSGFDSGDEEFEKRCIETNLGRVSYEYIKPYYSQEGKLCFVGFVDYEGGAGESDLAFDLSDKKALW